jgi:hypothetical protein
MTKGLSSWRAGRSALAAVVVAFLIVVAAGRSAQAGKRRVGVSLNGPHASTVHEAIAAALKHHGFETTSTDLAGDSDSAIAAAAKDGKLAAIIVGEVRDGGKRLKLRVYGSGGDLIGEGSWAEAGGIKKLVSVVERTLWARVGGSLSKARAGGDKGEAKAEPAEKEEAAGDEASGGAADADKTPTTSRSKDTDAQPAEEGDSSRKHKKKRAAAAEAEPDEEPTGSAATALDLAVGPRLMSRSLSWTPQVQGLRGYTLGNAPSLGASLAWYPAAHFRGGLVSNLGLAASLEYTPGLVSQTSDGSRYPTSASDFWAGARGRLLFGGAQVSLTLGGGQQVFVFHSQGAAMRSNLADLPDVGYTYARAAVDLRAELPAHLAVMVGGGYRYVIGAGDTNYLIQSSSYFPNSKFFAFDVMAALGWRPIPLLEVRAGFDLRRYQMSAGTNNYMVTSAVDQYLSLGGQVALLLDGYAAGAGGASTPRKSAAPAHGDGDGDGEE